MSWRLSLTTAARGSRSFPSPASQSERRARPWLNAALEHWHHSGQAVNEPIEPDKWYVTVNCSYCGAIIPISTAPAPRDRPSPWFRQADDLACPLCKHVDEPALMCRRIGQTLKSS